MPAIYDMRRSPISPTSFCLGRATDWIGPEEGPVRGIGQRVFLVGDDAVGIMEIATARLAA